MSEIYNICVQIDLSTVDQVLNLNPLFVKQVGPDGSVQHLDWHKRYEDMKQAAGITSPGKCLISSILRLGLLFIRT